MRLVAGFDEAGRGCLAGGVIAAAVVFPEGPAPVNGLADSKALSPQRREVLAAAIEERAAAWAIGRAEPAEIDRMNILAASLLAMQRAFAGLTVAPDEALVDGNRYPNIPCAGSAIVGGDRTVPVISAASILAKVWRDREMRVLDALFPGYGFAEHKAYPSVAHRKALARLGPSPVHRSSFGPVARLLGADHPSLLKR